jgi:hypothetical protein
MFKWIKQGRIWQPNTQLDWQQYYGILPTPEYLPEKQLIRVYFATACKEKYGRISYIDVDADNPSRIVFESPAPILDIGNIGHFDDCGLNPSCIIHSPNGQKYLYYIGYQRSQRAPYLLLAGAAIINADGTCRRLQTTPILERTTEEPCIRSATTILHEDGIYKMWYVAAQEWELMQDGIFAGKLMPNYTIRYATSTNALDWQVQKANAINYENPDEFGFGRPWVLKINGSYCMWYAVRKRNTPYSIGFATSTDGLTWQRDDKNAGIAASTQIGDWDSEMICYPAVVQTANKTYMFYNGNNNGINGFGYALLEK